MGSALPGQMDLIGFGQLIKDARELWVELYTYQVNSKNQRVLKNAVFIILCLKAINCRILKTNTKYLTEIRVILYNTVKHYMESQHIFLS